LKLTSGDGFCGVSMSIVGLTLGECSSPAKEKRAKCFDGKLFVTICPSTVCLAILNLPLSGWINSRKLLIMWISWWCRTWHWRRQKHLLSLPWSKLWRRR
jgi:hypothetical protein